LPKAVITEIKKKYGKILAAANKPPYKTVFSADVKDGIGKILMANKVKHLMGSHKESVDAITMSFDTYHGAVNEGKKSWLDTILAAQAKVKPEDTLDGKAKPKPVKEEIELDEAGQAKLYRMRQSHGRAWQRGDTEKQTAMGNATYDKQTKEDERDVKRTGSVFNMRVKRMAGNRKLLGLSDSFEVQNGVELDEASNTIPDSAIVLTQNLQKKTITYTWYDWNTEKWIEREVPQDEAPGFYTRAGTAMKVRKTDKYGNLLKAPVTDVDAAKRAKEMEAVSARNIVTAKDLLNTIEKKKTGTKFELFGTKNGKEHTLKIRKSMLMAQVVYFTTGDREVLFQATASGLTVMDKKTRRPLLSGGNDMIWESADLTDVGHMMIEISEATEKPKILERLIGQLKNKGMEVGPATAIATSTLQKSGTLKSGSHTLTKKGAERQGMGAAGRAKDRAATESGKPTKSYAYNPQTNKATLRT
jgi:hypothetical protein